MPAGPAPTMTTSTARRARAPRSIVSAEARRDLQPLDERVLDEAHAGQLADDVDARAAGLEELVDLGQLDAALGRCRTPA